MIGTADIGYKASGGSLAGLLEKPETYTTVCAWCGMIKGDDGSWEFSFEETHGPATHGICPACLSLMYYELHRYNIKKHAVAR